MKKIIWFTIILFTCFSYAQTHTWTGNAGDNNWFTASNWSAGTVPNAASTVLITENSLVEIIDSAAEVTSITLEETAVLKLENTLTFSQELVIPTNAIFQWNDGIIENGTIENDGVINIETLQQKELHDIVLNNRNEIVITDSGTIRLFGISTINNAHGAEININSPGGLIEDAGTATVNNDGLIRKINNGSAGAFYMIFDMNNSGIILLDEDQIFLFLVGSQNFTNYEDGFLLGMGSYDITANFVNNGYVYPGAFNFIGTLEFVNNFNFPPDAILEIDVLSPTEHDRVNVFGSPTIEGIIQVNLMDELNLDDEITVITSSNNLSCNLPVEIFGSTTNFSYTFDVICNTNSVVLKVSEIMELLSTEDFLKEGQFIVTPNPASDIIYFEYPWAVLRRSEGLRIEIYSIVGQKVEAISVVSESTSFNSSNLASGIYVAKLVSEKGVLATTKISVK